ncbi:MAG: BNR-4 repeat-containing protein [Bryobacterales bacterium]|nr:BNR-4 repeat-containing protein [Bryobacterales bacterium]
MLLALLVASLTLPLAASDPIVFNDDGGWCWFEDERVLVVKNRLVIGTVAAGTKSADRLGDVEVVTYDIPTGKTSRVTLHRGADAAERKRWLDDHNSPAFAVRPDKRLIAMYARHGNEEKIYYRVSGEPHDATVWQQERIYVPSERSRVTYTNLHWLKAEKRLYNFFRGLDNSFKPSYAWSEDGGETWKTGNVFINVPTQFRHRPYVKYASNGKDKVHVAYTEGHPRDFDNSVYHVFYKAGKLHHSSGEPIVPIASGLSRPEDGTLVFRGDKDNVAWVSDTHLDRNGNPVIVFSVQKNSAGMGSKQGGEDHRYHYARWNGKQWLQWEIAYGGWRLYPGEDDYTGNIAIDPQSTDTVYISTSVDPVTGKPLGSGHYEIYRGNTRDGGEKWQWTAVTSNSTKDNIRPIVPVWKDRRVALLWLRGKMTTYTDYDFEVVGAIQKR